MLGPDRPYVRTWLAMRMSVFVLSMIYAAAVHVKWPTDWTPSLVLWGSYFRWWQLYRQRTNVWCKKNNWTYLYTNRFYLAYIQKSTKTLFNLWVLNVHFNVWKHTVQSIYIYIYISFFRTDSSASARYDYCNQRNEYTIQTPIVTLTCDHAKDDTTNFPS